jgi:hypothetical protein
MELRCGNGILHGIMVVDGSILEVPCRSARCGKAAGVVVLHRFNIHTGKLVETLRFSEPEVVKEGSNGTAHESSALRSS